MDDRRAKSTRNGFVVASVLLFAALAIEYAQHGTWGYEVGTAFFLSQVAFWASMVYYR